MTTNTKFGWLLAVGIALGGGSTALAQDPGSCLVQSTSRIDALLNPAKGSDEKFFTSGGGPPNVVLVLDTSCSMADWPQDWPTSKGCNHAQITGLGFDSTATYPGMVESVTGNTPVYNPNWFNSTKYYDAPTSGYGTNFAGNPSGNSYATAAAACSSGGISGSDSTACTVCLATAGYYVYSSGVRRVWGKFLNFYAPRDSGAVLVLTQVVASLTKTRFALHAFADDTDSKCWGSSNKICLLQEMGPTCADSFPMNATAVDTHRNNILQDLKGNLKFGTNTPLASSVYAAGHYFKNKTAAGVDPFIGWFGSGYASDSDFNEEATTDRKSICASCGFNAMIVVTDGEPNGEVLTFPGAITSQTVTCVGGSCLSLQMAQVAKWWWEHDMRNDYTGVQKVATYTIGFSQDANSSGTLKTAAQYGGGKFYPATNTAALKSAIFTILDEVNSKNTSFSSAAIASVQSAGSTFAAILPRFSPQPNQPWIGSLQRFNLFNEFVEDYNLNAGEVEADGGIDTDKTDIWLVDNTMPGDGGTPTSSSRVLEDNNGKFVRWGTATPATPYWEAGGKMVDAGYARRKIYTVRDNNGGTGDGVFTSADTLTPFEATDAGVAGLGPYLGILGTSFCPSFAGTFTCNGGPNNGLACTLLADGGTPDCPSAYKCSGGTNNGLTCTLNPDGGTDDCPGGALKCNGGSNNGNSCTISPRDPACGYYTCKSNSKCDKGPRNDQWCATDADCLARRCEGVCVGGSDNGQNCLVAGDCNSPGTCSALSASSGTCGATPATCTASGVGASGDMLTKFGLTTAAAAGVIGVPVPTSQAGDDDLCVRTLIQFIRGRDLADEDGDGDRNETRGSVLGDIFHSSPAIVDPPVERFLCDIGLHNQCIRTLYSQQLNGTTATPLQSPVPSQYNCTPGPVAVTRDAYDAYQYMNRERDKVILVGANDGMLHAFHDGNSTLGPCVAGVQTIDYPAWDPRPNDPGTEVWAFIPPDMMPRLQEHVFGHAYFVDGDIMVRDIWADGSGATTGATLDGKKQWDEFHTLAVIADGRGGTHYTALELRYTNDPNSTAGDIVSDLAVSETAYNIGAPRFLWMYPQPGTPEASVFGKTLLSLSPKPPPIGPVLMERAYQLAPSQPNPASADIRSRYNCTGGSTPCDTSELWVVMLGGGWSPDLEKGRGVYMVDAWNGKVNGRQDNLLWKAEFQPGASGEQDQARREMRYSITAPVAMVDYGPNTRSQLDGFFDTATVGDTGGQIWLARFFRPGRINSSTRLVDNWSIARAFEMDVRADPNANGNNRVVQSVWPFYYITSVGIQPDNDAMRIFTGTGNRYALLEPQAGVCRFDNPLACAKYQCGDTKVEYRTTKNGWTLDKSQMHWTSNLFKGTETEQTTSGTMGPAPYTTAQACGANGTTSVTASLLQQINGCVPQSGPTQDYGDVRDTAASCGRDGNGNFFCKRTDTNNANMSDLSFTPQTSVVSALNMNRFFGLWAYGGSDVTRTFEEDRTAAGTATAKTATDFDGSRLSDRTAGGGTNATNGDLVDVTNTTCTTAASCTGFQATSASKGWFYEYSTLENRTASGSALLASCVLWNSIYPATAATTCGLAAVANGRFHQANFITGAPNCAAGFKDSSGNFVRAMDRGVQAPPPEPASAIQISKTGKIRYSALLVEPGAKQATEANVTTGNDVLQSVYELPVSRSLHNCRHVAGGSANCVEAPP